MIIHGNTLVSDELLEEYFACDVRMCKGACCVEGDTGAPLDAVEISAIQQHLPAIMDELDAEHRSFIESNGFYEKDDDGELVTKCLDNGQCCFVSESEDGILSCGMERAFYNNKSDFIKPISCHLYPVRIKTYETYTALNYHQWYLCKDACAKGQKNHIKVYEFVESALKRKFGNEWYKELKEIDAARSRL